MKALGFPVIAGRRRLTTHTLALGLGRRTADVAFVTVNTRTEDNAAARRLEAQPEGGIENMEGAAIVQVGQIYGIPVEEVKGVTNPVGTRIREVLRVREAAQEAQRKLLQAW